VAFHFLNRGLRLRERCLLLTARPAADIVVQADAMGFDFSEAVESGNLILLEYADDVPGRHNETEITLPPDSFMQLANLIAEQAVARVALDTCLPWVAVKSAAHLEEHVFSFIRSLDRMAVTSLLTMPKAASLASARLYKLVEAQVPVSLTLDVDKQHASHLMIVSKYLGMDDKVGLELAFSICPNTGICEVTDKRDEPESEPVPDQKPEPVVAPHASAGKASVDGDRPEKAGKAGIPVDVGLRFSDADSDLESATQTTGSKLGEDVATSEDVW
jgi:KaiC/GvpD/RAD55 family RecA-like ATPase